MSLQPGGMYLERPVGSDGDALALAGVAVSDHSFTRARRGNTDHRGDGAAHAAPPAPVVAQPPDLSNAAVSAAGQYLSEIDRAELVQRLVAAFRWHPHINNVLTHICGSQWTRIEQALWTITNPAITQADLSPLAQNIIELIWAERGVTGRILKPYLRELLAQSLPQRAADRLLCRIAGLCSASEMNRRHSGRKPATGGNQVATLESNVMDNVDTVKGERVIDVREIEPRIRHTVIFQLFEHLGDVNSLQLIADHDPRPLRLQLEAKHGNRCRWTYLERGPDVWRIRLQRYHGGDAP